MKNMIKMSLVACVAVAGLSSNVAAKPLEEAIKDVDISGSIVYRYNDYSTDIDGQSSDTDNFYKVATTLKSKVNDYVTASVRVIAGNANGSFAGLDAGDDQDDNVDIKLSHANFTVNTSAATVTVGKQGLVTPWTVAIDTDGDEQTGTGVLALVPAGPVTIAAAYFNQTNLGDTLDSTSQTALNGASVDGANIATIGIIGQAGPVALSAWYLDLDDILDTYTVSAKGKFGPVTIDARYTELETEDKDTNGNDENEYFQLKVSGKAGPVGLSALVGFTGSEGGLTALENTGKTTFDGWNVSANGKADADLYSLKASMNVLDSLNVALIYNTVDFELLNGNDAEETEFYTQITHKMGKNLTTYVRLGQYDVEQDNTDTVDSFRGRLQVQYTF